MTKDIDYNESELKKVVGDYLKRIRKNKGITAKELGDRIEYSQSHISGIENAKKTVPTNLFIKEYLLGLSESHSEFEKYCKDISKITNNFYNIDLEDKKVDKLFEELIKRNFTFEFTWREKNGEQFTEWFPFHINDMHFHLTDKLNYKYFDKIPLDNNDRNYINQTIIMYLKNKFNIKVIELQKDLIKIQSNKENTSEIEEVEKHISKLNRYINLLNSISSQDFGA
ncbi:helix-turn-helix domain-containing protein [Macrococcus armenti]|uniref:helix-turn-helix domain-containing protein n=1 Tax=Macrococcus armenti TaxID=2875764 RepID=UPI001CCEEC70|nr:helix-turn-helix transcriptional regulator [Macrococcus armenti]UBH09493.1 helix-turn-helix transcriptional regulator [Macrococcus armenti]